MGYLVGVLGNEKALGRVFEIGGPTVLTYADMLTTVARLQKGRDVAVVLEEQGVAAFAKSFDELIGALDAKAAELGAG